MGSGFQHQGRLGLADAQQAVAVRNIVVRRDRVRDDTEYKWCLAGAETAGSTAGFDGQTVAFREVEQVGVLAVPGQRAARAAEAHVDGSRVRCCGLVAHRTCWPYRRWAEGLEVDVVVLHTHSRKAGTRLCIIGVGPQT